VVTDLKKRNGKMCIGENENILAFMGRRKKAGSQVEGAPSVTGWHSEILGGTGSRAIRGG